jgi:hypothetical protein
MWHKKILSSIDFTHYLNDVFKLEGKQLEHTVHVVYQNSSSIYENYCKRFPESTGTLARTLKSMKVIPSDYIEPPLTYAIDEIAWAITHGYVHPRDVIVLKYKSTVNLLRNLSNDILKTMLTDEKLDSDPKLMHYLETELNIREGTNAEDFEDFVVKTIPENPFTNLKVLTTVEAKAAKLLFTPKPVEEVSDDVIRNSLESIRLSPTATFIVRQNFEEPVGFNTDVSRGIADAINPATNRRQVTQVNADYLFASVSQREIMDVKNIRTTTVGLNNVIMFRLPNDLLVVSRISRALRGTLERLITDRTFYEYFYMGAYIGLANIANTFQNTGTFDYLRILPNTNVAFDIFAGILNSITSGEAQPDPEEDTDYDDDSED